MLLKQTIYIALLTLTAACVVEARAQCATATDALKVADNWLNVIVSREGHWAGTTTPNIRDLTVVERDGLLLGYCAAVAPQGFVFVSPWTDFAPVKAFSWTSDLDPSGPGGLPVLLKDVQARRAQFLIRRFGGLDDTSLQPLRKLTPDSNRDAWSVLLLPAAERQMEQQGLGENGYHVGPLMYGIRWYQSAPFNAQCPHDNCPNDPLGRTRVGCVPLAMAMVMQHFCWPPHWQGELYDWPNTFNHEAIYAGSGYNFENEDGRLWTTAEINAVADLCADAGDAVDANYGCDSTGAHVCAWYDTDVRNAMRTLHYSDGSIDTPECEDRPEYTASDWFNIIRIEIDYNRPVVYRIRSNSGSLSHSVVVDGYGEWSGQCWLHANYGWGINNHTTWYVLDHLDCDRSAAHEDCDLDDEKLVRWIYPKTAIDSSFSGTLGPRTSPTDLHHYIYYDVAIDTTVAEAGAWIQLLPGARLACNSGTVEIRGGTPNTKVFSQDRQMRGIDIGTGGKMLLHPAGQVRIH